MEFGGKEDVWQAKPKLFRTRVGLEKIGVLLESSVAVKGV